MTGLCQLQNTGLVLSMGGEQSELQGMDPSEFAAKWDNGLKGV